MLEGAFTHQDFAGHTGTVHKGDVQWMTAGRGIIHSEKPVNEETQKRLQIWINLHSKDKMIEPYYQELLSADIKTAEKDGVHVRVIAGEFMGLKSSISTRTPTMLLDFTLKPRSIIHQPILHSWNAFIYVIEGECVICASNPSVVMALHVGVLGPGEGVSVWNKGSDILRFVLIGGEPINEPVVQYEQLVMNTRAELEQAFEDYKYHKNGFEMPKNG